MFSSPSLAGDAVYLGILNGTMLPFRSQGNTQAYRVEGRERVPGDAGDALLRVISGEYLQTLGVRLVGGRLLQATDTDQSTNVIVVNETLARLYFPKESPLGHRIAMWGVIARTIGYTVAALLCSALVRHVDHPWSFALRGGLVTGLVTGVGTTFNPFIEYYADNLPERHLGAFGIWLVLCGFALQSFQYWLAILDVHVT